MNDDQLLRYSRQIMLPQLDYEGQQKLLDSHALVIGLGGLGSPVAMYLAAAGVGTLTLVDFDQVDLSNLQRQIVHQTSRIGTPKVESAKQTLNSLNPEVDIRTINQKLEGEDLRAAVRNADIVIDASDNFSTRFAINEACALESTPLVSGAAVRMEGQVSVFPHQGQGQPCYNCLYSPNQGDELGTCSDNGVLSPVVGIIGSIQATEAIKVLAGIGQPLSGRLLTLDATTMEFREIRLRQDPGCPVCSASQKLAVS
ncbi:HesA/MoeB/ThiF family protein [Kaarinaea lacus]